MTGKEVLAERRKLSDAIYANETDKVAEILETFGFARQDLPSKYDDTMRHFARMALSAAAVAETENSITREVAVLIIEYIAPTVDVFDFLYAVCGYAYYESKENYEADIPHKLREALLKNEFNESAAEAINALSPSEFQSLVGYILGNKDIEILSSNFARRLMVYCYERNLIPYCLVFSSMAEHVLAPLRNECHGCSIAIIIP